MTKEEWLQVKEALTSQFKMVNLEVDGYKITLNLARLSGYKLAIMIYINGKINGKILFEDCEERRRFMCKTTHRCISQKAYKKLTKKQIKEMGGEEHFKFYAYQPWFNSFGTLKSQLVNNNDSITLVSID